MLHIENVYSILKYNGIENIALRDIFTAMIKVDQKQLEKDEVASLTYEIWDKKTPPFPDADVELILGFNNLDRDTHNAFIIKEVATGNFVLFVDGDHNRETGVTLPIRTQYIDDYANFLIGQIAINRADTKFLEQIKQSLGITQDLQRLPEGVNDIQI